MASTDCHQVHTARSEGQIAPLSRPDVSVKDVTASEAVEDVLFVTTGLDFMIE